MSSNECYSDAARDDEGLRRQKIIQIEESKVHRQGICLLASVSILRAKISGATLLSPERKAIIVRYQTDGSGPNRACTPEKRIGVHILIIPVVLGATQMSHRNCCWCYYYCC